MACMPFSLLLTLVALLICSARADLRDQSNVQLPLLQQHAGHRVSPPFFAELEELARVVDISYCVGLTSIGISKPFTCLSRCSDFPSFDLVSTWNTGPLLSDSCGYIALDHGKKRIIIAFRGTYSIANTVVDLSTVPQDYVPYPGEDAGDISRDEDGGEGGRQRPLEEGKEPKCKDCTVHTGFHAAWINTRERILPDVQLQIASYPTYTVNLVGHSLGGAVAALAGLDFQARGWEPLVTTFGEPRVGNAALATYLEQRFRRLDVQPGDEESMRYRRITHVDDPVPLLPLSEWGFAMHAGEIFISKSSLSPDIGDVRICQGNNDPSCIAGQDPSVNSGNDRTERDLIGSVKIEIEDIVREPWGIPSRYKLWQLFFAHRDYFWRLGLCLPSGDPLDVGTPDE